MDIKLIPESQVSNSDDFIIFKIIMLGDSGVGKDKILKRAFYNQFNENYQATIGFEFLLMHFCVNKLKIKLQIWDTCGQEMYRSLVQGFYRNTSLVLLVYDITNRKTYEGLDVWIKDIRTRTEPEMPIFIIGNKCDKEDQRQVTFDEVKEFSFSRRAKYLTECSSETGENVENIFYEAAKYLYSSYKQFGKKSIPSNILKIGMDNNEKIKKKKCC